MANVSEHLDGHQLRRPSAELGPAADLYPGMRRVTMVGTTSVLVHVENDGIYAIENSCPHYQVELSRGVRRSGYVECPWHHWLIDVRTGECLHSSRQRTRVLSVEIVDGCVFVLGDESLDLGVPDEPHLR